MAEAKGSIFFHYLYDRFYFPDRNRLKTFLRKLLSMEGKRIETINYIFCSDEYLLNLNRAHLGHDTLTDIISFELSGENEPLVSDIFVSIDRVKENALSFGTSYKSELCRVIFHGALHLAGYRDKSLSERKLMREKEDHYLKLYFVPRGTS